ncbi:hypothetical protein BZB76_3472 [Actinomadura pelletieri DSM 43383]|uniref:Uncharacterized protein n=2 Tax=Actinomadura pelletieri TaxID=111805 RepID=A0A495QPR5_9ACTN|nr:hypothetical protein BZB76_3472 [Actinomadura pelletieri DSM 43383]
MAEFDDDGLPMMDIARGDQSASRAVRKNLEILRDKSENPQFQRFVQEVLDGRMSLREAARSPLFDAELSPHIDKFKEKWDETMAEGQEVVDAEEVDRLAGLQAEVRRAMAEITEKVQELQRLKDELDDLDAERPN